MNAAIAREKPLTDDSRITKLEANVQHLQSDVTEIKGTLGWLRESFESFRIEVAKEFAAFRAEVAKEFAAIRAEVAKEFAAFRAEVAKEFGAIRGEIAKESGSLAAFRTEMAKEIGSLRTSIERAKLWMIVTGLGTILSVWGAAFALARFLKP